MRLRLLDYRLSRGPALVGICQGDIAGCAQIVNAAQERLVTDRGAGNEGWWGAWSRMAFNVPAANAYITLPREVTRLIDIAVCNRPIGIQNQFYEFLEFGIGNQPRNSCGTGCQLEQTYDRGTFPTFVDLATPNKTIRVYTTDPADAGRRVLIQGLDKDGAQIFSQDGLTPVTGEFLTLQSPFVQFPMELSAVTGIQKDVTVGVVKFYQVDLTTGDLVLLLTMEPSETTASYRRYFLNGLPLNCCSNNPLLPQTAQVTAMAKLALIPAQVDTDWLLIQSLEALIAECQAVRFDGMDSPGSDQKAAIKHHAAIGFLNGQLTNQLGKTRPAAIVRPFGSASLQRARIGSII